MDSNRGFAKVRLAKFLTNIATIPGIANVVEPTSYKTRTIVSLTVESTYTGFVLSLI